MNQEKYNLNWHTYSDHLRDLLHNMREMEYLTDVTLVCDDQKQFKAHKIVLSACSTVFKYIIDSLPLNSSVIYLRGIQHQEMESILDFMYLGAATFYQERMNEFWNVAKNLEIKEISKDIEFNDGEEANDEKDVSEHASIQPSIEQETNAPEFDIDRNVSGFGKRSSNRTVKNSSADFSCVQCNDQFTSKFNLTLHIQSIHEGVKHNCKQCDFQATQKGYLRTHIMSKH